jgi:CDP-diacylglycerol--glycerol-3-phosphate 3-phosphatidyltransferase
VISASDSGKQKTALQMIATMFLLIHFRYPVWGLENVTIKDEPLMINYHAVGIVTLYLALAMAVISGLDYFRMFVKAVMARKRAQEAAAAAAPVAPAAEEKKP